jgi:hypothetical protein
VTLPRISRGRRFRRQTGSIARSNGAQAFAVWAEGLAAAESEGRLSDEIGDRAGRRASYEVAEGLAVKARMRLDDRGRLSEAKLISIRRG